MVFFGRHVCEQQQAGVLCEAAEERQPTQQLLPTAKAPTVEAEVREGHQVPWRRVQPDADTPNVALRHAGDGGADGREVVGYLEEETLKVTPP